MSTDETSPTIDTGKEIAIPTTSADLSKASISNPYFTHHADQPGLVLVSKPLN